MSDKMTDVEALVEALGKTAVHYGGSLADGCGSERAKQAYETARKALLAALRAAHERAECTVDLVKRLRDAVDEESVGTWYASTEQAMNDADAFIATRTDATEAANE